MVRTIYSIPYSKGAKPIVRTLIAIIAYTWLVPGRDVRGPPQKSKLMTTFAGQADCSKKFESFLKEVDFGLTILSG